MNKAKLNYLLDLTIGIAFLLSAISGLVFLLPSGFGISYRFWDPLHTWSSLAMIFGVFLHLALHWKWIVSMTKRVLLEDAGQATVKSKPATEPATRSMSRRSFLRLGGIAVAGLGLFAVGYKAIPDTRSAETSQSDSSSDLVPSLAAQPSQSDSTVKAEELPPTPTAQPTAVPTQAPQKSGVACPFGLVNDPYPGRCRRYRDSNGNGVCDYSEPGSGNN